MRLAILAAAVTAALVGAVPAQAAGGLDLGFLDHVYTQPAPESDPWLQRTADAGADIVRLDIGWAAPDVSKRPAGFDARDPADPAYDFSRADAAIKAASAKRLQVLASFTGSPRWAEGSHRPADANHGSWRPDPGALEDYGVALATRYSGRFPDPADPSRRLPRVRAFQVWNEPNLSTYLAPQWSGRTPVAPRHYRLMLNAFYRGVKSVSPEALVVTAGMAPFGDPQPGGRIMPARFARELLCMRTDGGRVRGASCSQPARFDVFSHHPYSVGSPTRKALNADDVSIPDIGKLTRLLRAAERGGGALPRKRHRVWVTEVSYDSAPPDPRGVPIAKHARNLELALYLLWRQGVDTIIWFQVRDQLPSPSYAATNQSGIYFRDGRPKPALTAFRFPLVAQRQGRTDRVWGRSPGSGTLRIERRSGATWHTVRVLQVKARATFFTRMEHRANSQLRARLGNETSLVWTAD